MSLKKDLNNIHDKIYKDLFSTKNALLSFVNIGIIGTTKGLTGLVNQKLIEP